ncbi:DNA replication/checkpoint protein [Xylogone sp. PMI_703]|nr:DNA replication/checkpoint protein [Xylogone sp. PMI_703]
MNADEREDLTKKSTELRQELKLWEKEFSAANGGRKASRDDIKAHPNISSKYKEYNKIRDILKGKIPHKPPTIERQTPSKRRHEDGENLPISKRQHMLQTPSKGPKHAPDLDEILSPGVMRNLFTPKKTVIGPTPQKDGQVLGIFDLIPDEADIASPSMIRITAGTNVRSSLQATPQKSRHNNPTAATPSHARTPGSRGKLSKLDSFTTPSKDRTNGDVGQSTPSSVSKLHFPTPSFLRRDSQRIRLPVVNEDEEDVPLSPEMVRMPKRPLVRGLSSMLAGLRRMEEEAADDDLEALREAENGESTSFKAKVPPNPSAEEEHRDHRLPLGGFDDEAMYDTEPEEVQNAGLGPDGQPLKVWKKKGQKRTTRRYIIKPNLSKPQRESQSQQDDDHDTDDEHQDSGHGEPGEDEETVPETQFDASFSIPEANYNSDSQSEYTASEGGTRYKRANQSKGKNRNANKDGRIKTAARKVNALAHQNFKRLKLRNSGAKGGPGYGSRFRRKK